MVHSVPLVSIAPQIWEKALDRCAREGHSTERYTYVVLWNGTRLATKPVIRVAKDIYQEEWGAATFIPRRITGGIEARGGAARILQDLGFKISRKNDDDINEVPDHEQIDDIDDNLNAIRFYQEIGSFEAVVRRFGRSAALRAATLVRAGTKCELCGAQASFKTKAGLPYLEVHHIFRLADGGEDALHNMAAVCETCHRRIHFGQDGLTRNAKLKKIVNNR